MAESDAQAEATIQNPMPTVATPETEQAANTYPMSKEGRRQAIILLLGVVSIWIFALWTLITIVQDGVSGVEWVTGLLMLGILVVAPVVAWALLEEANARISVSEVGISYQTLGGVNLAYAWDDLLGFAPKNRTGKITRFFLGDNGDDGTSSDTVVTQTTPNMEKEQGDSEDEQEPQTRLVMVSDNHLDTIANPLVRFLHGQAQGDSLPIYGGLENRDGLVNRIKAHLIQV